jgi:hypothetical protein
MKAGVSVFLMLCAVVPTTGAAEDVLPEVVGCYVEEGGVCSTAEIVCDLDQVVNQELYGSSISRLCDAINLIPGVVGERDQCMTGWNALALRYNQNVVQYNKNVESFEGLNKRYQSVLKKAQRLKKLCKSNACRKVKL